MTIAIRKLLVLKKRMKRETSPQRSDPATLSSAEVWAAIRYLEQKQQRGTADILVTMALCWMVLCSCAM